MRLPSKIRPTLLALALLSSGHALADTCDQIRHDQLKYSECMRNDPSRNRPSSVPSYRHVPEQEEAPQESSYARERRLKREAAEAEQRQREQAIRDQETVRRQQADATQQRAFDAKRASDLALAKRVRAKQVAAVDALAARLADPKFDTPDTYDAIVTAAIPEADLMYEWAKRAYARFPKEFAFRHWLVMRSTCHPMDSPTRFDPASSGSVPCAPEKLAAPNELPAAALQGDLPNRVLNCAYLHFAFGTLEDTWGTDLLSVGKDTKVAAWARMVELDRKYVQTLQTCEKDLGDALPAIREGLFKRMWDLGKTRKNGLEARTASFIWLWRSQAVWAGRTSIEALKNPRTVQEAIDKAEALHTARNGSE